MSPVSRNHGSSGRGRPTADPIGARAALPAGMPDVLRVELLLVADELRAASRGGDYSDERLAQAVLVLGQAARRARLSSDELVATLRGIVFGTLVPSRPKAVADAVNVYLWRYARRGYHGDAPVRPIAASRRTELLDDVDPAVT